MDSSDIRQNNNSNNQYVRSNKSNLARPISAVVIFILLLGASFFGGISYEKGHVSSKSTASKIASGGFGGGFGSGSGDGGFGGGRFSGQRPIFGSVTAISSTSITLTNSRSGSSETYAIDPSTTITDNGSTVSTSDIQTGDTVVITLSSSSSTTASKILVNPSFGSGQVESSNLNNGSSTTTQD